MTAQPTDEDTTAPSVESGVRAENLSNLLWLLPDMPRSALLVVNQGTSRFTIALRALFDHTVELEIRQATEPTLATLVGHASKSADLVVVDFDAIAETGRPAAAAFFKALRAPRRGGGSYVMLHFKARAAGLFGSPVANAVRALEQCQAHPERMYYVAPSLAVPLEFVPVDARAVLSLESHTPRGLMRRLARRVLIALGWHHVLFQDAVVVARL